MNFNALKAELELPAYSAMSDQQAEDALNLNDGTIFVSRNINYKDILREVDSAGVMLDKLESAAVNIPDLKWGMIGVKSPEGINIGVAKTRTQIGALATANLITNAEASALKGMTDSQSRAEEIGLGNVTLAEVIYVRSKI